MPFEDASLYVNVMAKMTMTVIDRDKVIESDGWMGMSKWKYGIVMSHNHKTHYFLWNQISDKAKELVKKMISSFGIKRKFYKWRLYPYRNEMKALVFFSDDSTDKNPSILLGRKMVENDEDKAGD